MALLHDNSSYARGLAEETQQVLKNNNIKVVFYDALTPGEKYYLCRLGLDDDIYTLIKGVFDVIKVE